MASVKIKNAPELEYIALPYFYVKSTEYGGLAKSARFMVRIIPSGTDNALKKSASFMRDLSYLCESAEFPSRGFQSMDIRYYGSNFKVPYQTSYEDLNLTFLCRDKFLEREFFDTWMEIINPSSTANFSYRNTYACTIELFQLSDIAADENSYNATAQYKFTFNDAWPILVNPQPVTWADDNFHRLTVSFTYNRWSRDELDSKTPEKYDLVKGASSITTGGTTIPRFNTEFKNK